MLSKRTHELSKRDVRTSMLVGDLNWLAFRGLATEQSWLCLSSIKEQTSRRQVSKHGLGQGLAPGRVVLLLRGSLEACSLPG